MPKRIKILLVLFTIQLVLYLMLYQTVPISVCYAMVIISALLNFRDHLRTIIFINQTLVSYVPYNVAVYWALPEVIIHFLNYYIIGLN